MLSFRVSQIIQLVQSPQSGQFFAWVVVEGLMLKIPLTIPRVFYINSKASIAGNFTGKCINKILPHGKPCYNLMEARHLHNTHILLLVFLLVSYKFSLFLYRSIFRKINL